MTTRNAAEDYPVRVHLRSYPCVSATRSGIAGLLVTVAVSLFILSIGILIAAQGGTSIFAGQAAAQANRAQFLAETGVEDALVRLARYKGYTGSYALTEVDGTVAVSVSGASSTPTIVSTSTVSNGVNTVQRTIQAQLTIDGDGKITSIVKTNQ